MEYYQFELSMYFPQKVYFSMSKEELSETLKQTNLSKELQEKLQHYEVVYEAFHNFLKIPVFVAAARSASRTTRFSYSAPNSARALP